MTTPLFAHLVHHGIAGQDPPLPRGGVYTYRFAANGIFLCAESPRLSVRLCIHPFAPGTVRGLPTLEPFIRLHHPRIPSALLHRVIEDARTRRNSDEHLIEALYRVVLHPQGERIRFALLVPHQTANVGSVTTDTPREDYACLELHTHGALPAFWSSTDDHDEGGFGFYGVVGRLDHPRPDIRLRVGVYGYWWEVPLDVLFEEHDSPTWEDVNAQATYGVARWRPQEAQ